MYKTIYTEVEVDVDLADFETDDLIEELQLRGVPTDSYGNAQELIEQIWLKRRLGKDVTQEVDLLTYQVLGKVI